MKRTKLEFRHTDPAAAEQRLVLRASGDVPVAAVDYAVRRVGPLLTELDEPRSRVRVRLTRLDECALVQANLDLGDCAVRVQEQAADFRTAVHVACDRLDDRAGRLAADRGVLVAGPDGGYRRAREEFRPLPVHLRTVMRHKLIRPVRSTPDGAVRTLDLMDYDFHLFVDAETGQDSVIFRAGPTGYRLTRLRGQAPPAQPPAIPLTRSAYPVRRCTAPEVVRQLDATELPFRFFRDADTDRGAVLYRRFDGHYALISPLR